MKIQEMMTRDVHLASPDNTIGEAARMMAEIDAGVIPVGENDRLIGMLTDRDIAVRAVAQGKGPDTRVRDVMSPEVCYCFADQEADEVAANMADIKVRRLPVVDRDKRLVGIISLSDMVRTDGADGSSAEAFGAVSVPGGAHSQTNDDARPRTL